MKKMVRIAIAAMCVGFVAGCAGMISGGPLIRPGEPTGVIQVANGSGYNVNVVLISACNVSTYGLNRLPDGAGIPPGGSYNFTVSAGCWDVSAGSTGGAVEARQRMNIAPNGGVRYTVH